MKVTPWLTLNIVCPKNSESITTTHAWCASAMLTDPRIEEEDWIDICRQGAHTNTHTYIHTETHTQNVEVTFLVRHKEIKGSLNGTRVPSRVMVCFAVGKRVRSQSEMTLQTGSDLFELDRFYCLRYSFALSNVRGYEGMVRWVRFPMRSKLFLVCQRHNIEVSIKLPCQQGKHCRRPQFYGT